MKLLAPKKEIRKIVADSRATIDLCHDTSQAIKARDWTQLNVLLANRKTNQPNVSFTSCRPNLLTVAETADILGVTPKTVYNLVASGQLPVRRIGTGRGSIRIPRKALKKIGKPKPQPVAYKYL